jgi:hypothetical protein
MTARRVFNHSFLGLPWIRHALEDENHALTEHKEDPDVTVTATCLWLLRAGNAWFGRFPDGWDDGQDGMGSGIKYSLWKTWRDAFVVTMERCKFW